MKHHHPIKPLFGALVIALSLAWVFAATVPPPRAPVPAIVAPGGNIQAALNAGGVVQLQRGGVYRLAKGTYLGIAKDGTTFEATGDPTKPAPIVSVADGMAVYMAGRSNVVIRGIEFAADTPTNVGIGIGWGGGAILIDSCSIHGFTFGGTAEGVDRWPGTDTRIAGVTLLNCVVTDNWCPGGRSSGFYFDLVDGIQLIGNVFDHNGWGPKGESQSNQNHGVYICARCGPAVVKGNVFSRSSNFGLQARSGGDVVGNLFFDDPNGASHGAVNGQGPVHAGGTVGTVSGNAIFGAPPCGKDPGGDAILVGNSHAVTVSDNLIAAAPKSQAPAIMVAPCLLTANSYVARGSPDGVVNGIDSLVVSNNAIYGWAGGEARVDPSLKQGAGANGFRSLQVIGNGAPARTPDPRALLGLDDATAPAWKRFRAEGTAKVPAILKILFDATK
jgi:hypothetical protein